MLNETTPDIKLIESEPTRNDSRRVDKDRMNLHCSSKPRDATKHELHLKLTLGLHS